MTSLDLSALDGVQAFAGLDPGHRAELAVAMAPFSAAAGELLFRQGDPPGPLYVLTRGRVRLTVRVAGGGSEVIGDVEAGEVLGAFGASDPGPRSATACAVEDTSGFTLSRAAFDSALAALRPAAYALLRPLAVALARRTRQLIDRMAGTSTAGVVTLDARHRLRWDVGDPHYRRRQLEELPAAAAFASDELDRLLVGSTWLDVPRGHVVLDRGEAAGCLAIVVRGAVQGTVAVGPDDLLRVPLKAPGQTLGEIALLDGAPQPVAYRTREPTTLVELPAGRWSELLDGQDTAGFKLLDLLVATLGAGLRRGNQRLVHIRAQKGFSDR